MISNLSTSSIYISEPEHPSILSRIGGYFSRLSRRRAPSLESVNTVALKKIEKRNHSLNSNFRRTFSISSPPKSEISEPFREFLPHEAYAFTYIQGAREELQKQIISFCIKNPRIKDAFMNEWQINFSELADLITSHIEIGPLMKEFLKCFVNTISKEISKSINKKGHSNNDRPMSDDEILSIQHDIRNSIYVCTESTTKAIEAIVMGSKLGIVTKASKLDFLTIGITNTIENHASLSDYIKKETRNDQLIIFAKNQMWRNRTTAQKEAKALLTATGEAQTTPL